MFNITLLSLGSTLFYVRPRRDPDKIGQDRYFRQNRPMILRFAQILIIAADIAMVLIPATAVNASPPPAIYPDPSHAQADLDEALMKAAALHRRVIVAFGANWCGDCRVLERYFREEPNGALLQSGFVLVHVNIGDGDRNLDLAARFRIPLYQGVPALAVLSDSGQLIYSQKAGEFEGMRRMSPSTVTEFLTRWQAAPVP
jgi:thioredoxin 1